MTTPMWPTYLYVDSGFRSQCHNYRQGYGPDLCEEVEKKTEEKWVIVRCVYCHDKEIKNISCLGTTQSGRRCKNENVNRIGYCTTHSISPPDRFQEELDRYDPDLLIGWHDHYEQAVAAKIKRTILRQAVHQAGLLQVQLADLIDQIKGVETYVYVIQCKNYVKIGKSNNPKSRLKTLQSPNNTTLRPKDLSVEDLQSARILTTIKGNARLERRLHSILYEKRIEGEWFVLDSYVAKIIDGVQDTDQSLEAILKLAAETPEILPQDVTEYSFNDFGIYEALKQVEARYSVEEKRTNSCTSCV